MKTKIIIGLICLTFLLAGCGELPSGEIPEYVKACQESEECIPYPGELDTKECINFVYEEGFEKAPGHSTHFIEGAVYLPEHCLCVQDKCTNKANVTQILPSNLEECVTDSDCIPLPSDCHARSCINKEHENLFDKPQVCTELFDTQAAYKVEDCSCNNGKCKNDNLWL